MGSLKLQRKYSKLKKKKKKSADLVYTVYKERTNLLCQKEIVSAVLPSKQKPKKVPPFTF